MVEVHDIDHQLLQAVLIYLYTDQVEVSPHKIDDLAKIGLKYGLVRMHNLQMTPSYRTTFLY